jgi:uncharacterized MAPEG superfamily protein
VRSENPGQFIIGPVIAPLYLAAVPLANYLSKPEGVSQKLLDGMLKLVPGGPVASDRVIPAISALYIFWAFGGSAAFSAAGQGMARKDGFDNNSPRAHIHKLQGLPLRLRSAHYNLIENFAGFALAAALVQTINPRDQQNLNLLALHVFLKLGVHYVSYVADIALPRTLSHVLATGSVIGVCWRLAVGA